MTIPNIRLWSSGGFLRVEGEVILIPFNPNKRIRYRKNWVGALEEVNLLLKDKIREEVNIFKGNGFQFKRGSLFTRNSWVIQDRRVYLVPVCDTGDFLGKESPTDLTLSIVKFCTDNNISSASTTLLTTKSMCEVNLATLYKRVCSILKDEPITLNMFIPDQDLLYKLVYSY